MSFGMKTQFFMDKTTKNKIRAKTGYAGDASYNDHIASYLLALFYLVIVSKFCFMTCHT